MPDFVMCQKHNCIKIKDCYRYRAIPDRYQSYTDFINLCNEKDNYKYLIKIREDDKIQNIKIKEGE